MDATERDEDSSWAAVIARRLVERARQAQEQRRERRERGRRAARRLAEALRGAGATRVWLFGSLAGEGGLVHDQSDVDIAVDGLPRAARAEALARVRDIEEREGVRVDLVALEEAAPALRARIRDEGEELFVARV